MATLYLHIGTPKTGTTAIQHFCAKNRRALRRYGYSFPRTKFYPGISSERNAYFLVADARKPDGSFWEAKGEANWRRSMDFLSAQFRRYPNVILSDEGIWSGCEAPWSLWRDLRAAADARGFEVKIIVYLRRQDQFLESLWVQGIKFPPDPGSDRTWKEMLESGCEQARLDYYQALEEIAAQFGREAITVRVYDRSRFEGGNILADFLGILGAPKLAGIDSCAERNPSLRGNAVEIVRIINAMPGMPPEALRSATRAALACCAAEGGAARCELMTVEERRALLGRYAESNRRVARDYLGDESGRLFPEPEDAERRQDGAEMYETIIRFFAAAVFSPYRPPLRLRLRRRIRELRGRAWRLRAGLAARRDR